MATPSGLHFLARVDETHWENFYRTPQEDVSAVLKHQGELRSSGGMRAKAMRPSTQELTLHRGFPIPNASSSFQEQRNQGSTELIRREIMTRFFHAPD